LKLVPAATLNQNPIFEMASNFLSARIHRFSRLVPAEFPMTGGWRCKAVEFNNDFTNDPRRSVSSYNVTTI
jgi:hypothetical protein